MNGVPDSEWFRERFTFTSDELLRYIRAAGIGQHLSDKAGDNRGFPNPYLIDRQGGYEVGWVEVDPVRHSAKRFFVDLDEAAADYVLAYWQLGRLENAKTETDELEPPKGK